MPSQGFLNYVIPPAQVDGPTLTAAAAASMLPTHMRTPIYASYFDKIGKQMIIRASGRISCVVTTPGTARFDVRLNNIVVFDSLAINLNVVAKTTVGWWLEILLTARAVGNSTNANLMGQGIWTSEALVGSPVVTAGGNGSAMLPYNVAPAVGAGFDSTAANPFDMFFTQTVATGSMTMHQCYVIDPN